MTGQFQEELTDFTLGMSFPVVEESSDRLKGKNDSLRLANDIVSNIQSALGTRDGLPAEVIKSVFAQYSFLDSDDVDQWITQSAKAMNEERRPFINHSKENLQESKSLIEKIDRDLFTEAYIKALNKHYVSESNHSSRHFVNSACSISSRDKQELEDFRREKSSLTKSKNLNG